MAEYQFDDVVTIADQVGYDLSTVVRDGESRYLVVHQHDPTVSFIFKNLADVMAFLEPKIQRQQLRWD